MKRKIFFILLAAVFAAGIAFAEKLPVAKAFRPEKELYKTFANPDARHRPYVRWWWNGARYSFHVSLLNSKHLYDSPIFF